MSEDDKPLVIYRSAWKRLLRALLRAIPLLPAPELYDLIEDLKRSRTSLDKKIDQAFTSLQETSRLISELEGSLKERAEKLNFLRQEVERYSKLAEVEEGKAKALIQQLELSLNKGKIRERWVSLLINLIAGIIVFLLGILAGPTITSWLGFY